MDQPRHQVHERRLARAVRPDEARDAGRDVQRDTVDAEHFSVELRDLVEYHGRCDRLRALAYCAALRRDLGGAASRRRRSHDTISTGRSLRSITRTSSETVPASAHADAPAPGPSGGV